MSTWQESRAALAELLNEELHDVYDDAPCGYVSTLPDGTILKLNRTFGEWLGFTPQELLGRRVQTLLTIGGQIYWETHYAPLLAMQGYVSEMALDLKDRGGNVLPVLLNSRLRRDRENAPRLVKTVVFNATERRRYERELLRERKRADEQARAKAELLRMLSHDVRSPLSTILTIARLQANDAQTPVEQGRARILQSAAGSILSLVDQVLAAERLEASGPELRPTRVVLRAWLEAFIEPLRMTASEKGLTLTVMVADAAPDVLWVDPVALEQVLTNLIVNGMKFTERGGISVTVEVVSPISVERTSLAFKVGDTGVGIQADRLTAILEPFVQGTADTARQYGGSGLGLSICAGVLRRMGSRLEVQSEPGAGSSFRLVLDLSLSETAPES